ncbi:MAG: TIGR04282 family arsenosugar biosynthesis glycosyltransferase [Candidatus Omnitrophica bacterium]|nr:TIGR04282 family arsenosugar biosynthesis glycosyltransferase [Candidatus Omnitrophota bacterium]
MSETKNYLSVFMKTPDAEEVKTRLMRALPREDAVRLYKAFVEDILERLSDFSCDVKVISYLGVPPARDFFSSKVGEVKFWPQQGRDLGERMRNYFSWSFEQGARKSIVIGSDSPTLPTAYLEEAFALLDPYEVVIGPSIDGGYYLLGMRKLHPELFNDIPWGEEEVFQKTIFQNRHLEGSIGLLGPWYDVDTPEALVLLKGHLEYLYRHAERELPQRTYRILSELEA